MRSVIDGVASWRFFFFTLTWLTCEIDSRAFSLSQSGMKRFSLHLQKPRADAFFCAIAFSDVHKYSMRKKATGKK